MIAYKIRVTEPAWIDNRWELYRVLAEPLRLRLLAAAAQEELTIGELAELVGESQPNVSRHVTLLRKLDLLAERKQGTRVLVRLADPARSDPVVSDALVSGRALCEREGTLERIAQLVKRRDAPSREFFARPARAGDPPSLPDELAAYLMLVAPLMIHRELAIDVGTGEGRLLEVLAPLFDHAVGIDREPAQLERAAERVRLRGFRNVELLQFDLLSESVDRLVGRLGRADAVFASRVLHHAPRPAQALASLAALARPGGAVIVLDYAPHDDETMREQQADLWLGFGADELSRLGRAAGLADVHVSVIPKSFRGSGPDCHLTWQVFSGRRRIATEPVAFGSET